MIKELMGEFISSSEGNSLETEERDSILDFLSNFSLEEGIDYADFYSELEETIQQEIDQFEESAFLEAELEYLDVDEEIQQFDVHNEEESFLCPMCW